MLRKLLKHISLQDLVSSKLLSIRSFNCCTNARFKSLYDIISYYEQGGDFRAIRNAGRKTCSELELLCKSIIRALKEDETSINKQVLPNNLKTLFDLKGFDQHELTRQKELAKKEKEDEKALEELKKAEEEIKKCETEKIIKENLFNAIYAKLINPEYFFDYVTIEQKEIISTKYKELSQHYSVRTKNRLLAVGFEDFVKKYLFADDITLLDIRNLGKRSLGEAVNFKEKIKSEVYGITKLTEADVFREKIIRDKGKYFANDFVFDYYAQHNHLPMFWIAEQNLKAGEDRNVDIFVHSYPMFANTEIMSLKELAKKYDIKSERVRQIRNKMYNKAFDSDNLLFQNIEDWEYYKTTFRDKKSIWLEDSEIQQLLKQEQSNFSNLFALLTLSFICFDTHTYFGKKIDNKDSKWNNSVLIKKDISDIFDFKRFREEFCDLLTDNETEKKLDVDNFVSNSSCWLYYDYDKLESVSSIIQDILLHEFGIYSEIDGGVIIPANKEKNPLDVVYEILKQNGKPMHIDDIFEEFKNKLPDHQYTEANQIRHYLHRHDSIGHRNRKSVYTLKEWKHIKSGTIRGAILEFLSNNESPQSAEVITEYVLQFFPKTNLPSVRTTMINAPKQRFLFFENNLFGLKGKEYPAVYKLVENNSRQRRNFEQRLYDLEKFITEQKHFPFSSSKDKSEESLNRWWKRVIDGKTTINELQKAEVERVKEKYADYNMDKISFEWNLNYNKLKCFLLKNKFTPSATGADKYLYYWLRRAKDDFQNYRLTDEQRKKYIELVKLM